MSDAALCDLAARAGIAAEWTDSFGAMRIVAPPTLRAILSALGLPCRTAGDIAASRERLARRRALPRLIVGSVGQAIPVGGDACSAELHFERGGTRATRLRDGKIPPMREWGYHRLAIGRRVADLAVAPARGFSVADLSPRGRLWGVTAQVYGLKRSGDGGIGDFGGVAELARALGRAGADAVALSPIHALFGAAPERFAPYSPSSRRFLNPLHADPTPVLGPDAVRAARLRIGAARRGGALIDWPPRSREKHALFRALFDAMPMSGPSAADLANFTRDGGDGLAQYAAFEARATGTTAAFQIFLQFLARRSLAAAQQAAKESGMRIGLIADVAVGVDPHGADAAIQGESLLRGLTIGAPPDLFNPNGQNWGLTGLSPTAMVDAGYAPFLDVLRAAMAETGGIRIDHALGLRRLWLIPDGAPPDRGAYLAYPFDDLLRLIVLESRRNRSVVIAEDLGTVPPGFGGRLSDAGILGMSILYFERDGSGFRAARRWRRDATAMSSTHDLPPVAGWWRGNDIAARRSLNIVDRADAKKLAAGRDEDRAALWRAMTADGGARGRRPGPRQTNEVVDAALRFVARTPSRLALFPLEDIVGAAAQPNLPGTIGEHPNWRRRQKAASARLLAAPKVAARLRMLKRERPRA